MVSVFHGGRTAWLVVGRVERRCLTFAFQSRQVSIALNCRRRCPVGNPDVGAVIKQEGSGPLVAKGQRFGNRRIAEVVQDIQLRTVLVQQLNGLDLISTAR